MKDIMEFHLMECLVVKFAAMKDLAKEWLLMVVMECQVWGSG